MPIIIPAFGVNPIEVSTHLPFSIAVTLPPFPKWQTITLMFSLSPFGLAIIAGALSNNRPIGIMYVLSLIGTFVRFGFNNLLIYFVTSLVFFVLILLIRPRIEENVNEQKKIGGHLFFSVTLVQIITMFFDTFYVFELLSSIMLGMTTYIFYKIFVNSINMIINFETKRAFTIEEVMGTSLLLSSLRKDSASMC